MKNLPIGIQTLPEFLDFNFIYVDKTEMINQLVTTGKYYFLSRPRRFGKSLLISTIKELFEGNKKSFKGLWIEDKWDWTKINPVIHISFDNMGYKSMGLKEAIEEELKRWAKKYDILLEAGSYETRFKELLEKVTAKHGAVVLLIDEYDRPIVDFLGKDEIEQAKSNQAILREFYAILKGAAPFLRLIFVTGISKFTKTSMFSVLNNLKDITLTPKYATLTGYTQEELEFYFEEYIDAAAKDLDISREDLLENMKVWYNGFSWDGVQKVYNPFGTLNFFDEKQFSNYWFSTGTPTMLLKQMQKQGVYDVENTEINGIVLESYELDNLEIIPLLFQTGYLTIKKLDKMTNDMVLDYPNKEVRQSMYRFLVDGFSETKGGTADNLIKHLTAAFQANNLDHVRITINSVLAGLPYQTFEKQTEGLYHGLVHLIFKLLGTVMQSEVHSARGRADCVVKTATHIYIFEFKFNKTAEEAIAQIDTKKYGETYRTSGKQIVGIGVNFNLKEREIDGWVVKDL